MKIVRIFGVVLALHVVGGILFIQPGCQSQPRPDTSSTVTTTGEPAERLDWENWEPDGSASDRPRSEPTRPASRPAPTTSLADDTLLQPLPSGLEPFPSRIEPLPATSTAGAGQTAGTGSTSTYTVRGGDSLWKIANSNGISLAALLSANGLTENSVIQPGQSLRIPGGSSSTRSASPAASAASSRPEGTTTYTVRSGDSLSVIARRHNTTVQDLKALNKMSSDIIRIDQKLVVPEGSSSGARPQASAPATRSSAPSGSGTRHTVQSGETPGGIASQYGVSVTDLMSTNNISDPRRMKLGQELVIPGTGSSASGGSPTPSRPRTQEATRPAATPSTAPVQEPARSLTPRNIPVIPADEPADEAEMDEDDFPIIPIVPAGR